MRKVCGLLAAAVGLCTVSASALSADIARLEWGGFVVVDDTSNGWSDTKSVSSDDGRSVTLTFSSLEAKADGETLRSEARIAGRYEIVQPSYDKVSAYRVDIAGLIAKGANTSAALRVRVGAAIQVIDWPPEQQISEKFERTLTFAVPADGRLPSPLDLSVQADVSKDGVDNAAYLSVSSLTLTAEYVKVATSNQLPEGLPQGP